MTDYALAPMLIAPDLAAILPALSLTPLDQNPAAVYLAWLSEGLHPTIHTALNSLARMLGVGERRDAIEREVRCLDVPWS